MAILADIVFIVDESGSMTTEQDWLASFVLQLDTDLVSTGISPQYAIVGFATNAGGLHPGDSSAHKHLIGGQDFSSDATLVSNTMDTDLIVSGGSADVYEAIDYTLNGANYAFRDGATTAFVIVTDAQRESPDLSLTYATTSALLSDNNVLCAWVVKQPLQDTLGNTDVMGGNWDLTSYSPDGAGGFTTGSWDIGALPTGGNANTVKEAYVDLALAVNGSAWDLNYLDTSGGIPALTVTSFSAAFSTLFGEEIIAAQGCPEIPSPIPFYCPSSNPSLTSAIIFTQSSPAEEYLTEYTRQFIITFYADEAKQRVVYSTSSAFDSRRWYTSGATYEAMPASGAIVESGESIDIIYIPDVYPQQLFRQQSLITLSKEGQTPQLTESYLLSGVTYYITITAYDLTDPDFETEVIDAEYKFNASDLETNFWRENMDKNNWICSANGQSDLLVSDSGDRSIFPSISANSFDLFYIANQSLRGDQTTIARSYWNAEDDVLYSSGQGLWETTGPNNGQRPHIITDQGQSFYIVSTDDDNFYSSKCALPSEDGIIDDPSVSEAPASELICYPGTATNLSSDVSDFVVRVEENDTTGSFVINRDDVVSVVEKTNIDIDISGIYGAYAVRIRNQNGNWVDWISINDSNFIENNRFKVPWTLPRENGLRHLCCQVLTIYGMTEVKCIDIFVNMDTVDYLVEYYYDELLTDEVPSKDGFALLGTTVVDGTTGKQEDSATIYVKVTFSEAQSASSLLFDVTHQGISNIFDHTLTKIASTGDKQYKGEFDIFNEDGIYNKDGNGFLKVKFTDSDSEDICVSDKRDLYNQMLIKSELDFLDVVSKTPEDSFNETTTRTVSKAININEFKQYYDNDDPNLLFGDLGFYKD